MADEILWQAKLHPKRPAGDLTAAESRRVWEKCQSVCRISLETIGEDYGDPPDHWLIHVRWKPGGHCPKHGLELCRETIAGRTTAWCPKCQPAR
jgi:formamidopyrimidine-DNA glycosylase